MKQVAEKTKQKTKRINCVSLKDLADIKAGYPFRGAVPDKPEKGEANASVIRLKDVSIEEPMNWRALAQANLQGRKKPDWLQDGDILFQARGSKSNAYYLYDVPERVVCAPHFFQIRVNTKVGINPEFLAWQINQLPIQGYFDKNAGGTVMRHVSRSVLEQVEVLVPPMETQDKVVALANTLLKEKLLFQALTENNAKFMQGIAEKILSTK